MVPEGGAYFDCANRGLVPRAAAEIAALGERAWGPPWMPTHEEELRAVLVEVVADIIGVRPEEIALIPSVSYGMALARSMVGLKPGDQVLMLEMEHPAAALAWYAQCRITGARVLRVSSLAGDLTEAILAAMDPSVRIVSLPQVHWMDGTPIDLPRISSKAKELGAILIVDGTQSVGGRPFKVSEFNPDIVTFSGYKWLFGPIGVAYLYVSPALRDAAPFEHSWISYAGNESRMFDDSGAIGYPPRPLQGMRRFDASGLQNPLMLRLAAAGAALAREVGAARILAHNAGIISRLQSEFKNHLPTAAAARHFCGMVVPNPRHVAQSLAERSVYTSARGIYLRISPNIWNDDSDVAALIAQLRSLSTL